MTQGTKLASARAKKYSLDLARYYRNASTQVSLSLVLSLFIVAFFILVALKPTFVTIAELTTEIEDTEQTLAALKTKSISLQQASVTWESIQDQLPYVETSIPHESPQYQQITKSMEVLAREAGVEVTSLNLGDALLYSQIIDIYTGREQKVVEMDMAVRVKGNFAQTLAFLEALLEVDRLVKIDSVTMTKEVEGGQDVQIGMSITGAVSYLADEQLLNKSLSVKAR